MSNESKVTLPSPGPQPRREQIPLAEPSTETGPLKTIDEMIEAARYKKHKPNP